MYYQDNQSILEKEQVSQVHDAHGSWMESIIKIKSARCSMIGDQLYKRSYSGPYLKCLDPEEAKYVLSELHEGVCGNHLDGRTLAPRAHTQGIICHFGIPRIIISNNESQFDSSNYIKFSEVTNKSQLDALRKRLQGAGGHWVEELPGVVWAYQTMPRCPTEETHFSLAYGMKVVISTEVGMPTFRTT
ncbi:hypothetical protein AAG906_012010 [Vitis piasezkii]